MSNYVEERADGGFAFYIDGDLQFDTLDEALYHESLALPALCLAQRSRPDGLRVLICGGGDGLALRECLRFPGVVHADLVDYSPEVVELGRTRFAERNEYAFEDARANVHIADAWEFLNEAPAYDVVLCDFTVPRRPEDTRIFTREWYERIETALAPGGIVALNGVSPQATPEAFWCLHRTVRAAGLSALPYRVCIPSFRAQGYGAWAFLLAARHPLRLSALRDLRCPVPTRQTDLPRLWRGAHFSRQERRLGSLVPLHSLAEPHLLRLLLNPGDISPASSAFAANTFSLPELTMRRDETSAALPEPLSPSSSRAGDAAFDPLVTAIPVLHPYHTRDMIETLARQVLGSVRALDIKQLVEALLQRGGSLPGDLLSGLKRLSDTLRARAPRLEAMGTWGLRLFATLVILMTLANAIAPDNAFAKGSFGLGHASMSRGFSSSFSGARGFTGGGRVSSARGSFSGARGMGSSFGSGGRAPRTGFFGTPRAITSAGFRRSYGRGQMTDIYGNVYASRTYIYCGSGGGHIHPYYHTYGAHNPRPADMPPPQEHKTLFAADDDMLVMENGDVLITLSDSAYLLVTGGTIALFHAKIPDPLLALYPDPQMFDTISGQIVDQQTTASDEAAARRDWLGWTGWTSALFPVIAEDRTELRNLEDLGKRLNTALTRLGKPANPPAPAPLNALSAGGEGGAVELFNGCFLLPDDRIAFCGPEGRWRFTDGRTITSEVSGEKPARCAPELAEALKSILLKLQKEFTADLTTAANDLTLLQMDLIALNKDLAEYQNIFAANGYQYDYEVDYGTEVIGVSDAIARTRRDITGNQDETQKVLIQQIKTQRELGRINVALQRLGS